MSEAPLIDMIAATVVCLAMIRGVFIGLVREGLSLVAIGLCTIVTRLFVDPVSVWLTEVTANEVTGKTAVWIAGVLLVVGTILVCGLAAKLLKRSLQFAGLGWADRLGGGALGVAEGSIVAAVLVMIAIWLVGTDHPLTEGARSVELVEVFRSEHADDLEGFEVDLPSVASPGKWF